MVSEIFIFDFDLFFDFDRKVIKMMPILPIYSSTFGQMGMAIDGFAPSPNYIRKFQ